MGHPSLQSLLLSSRRPFPLVSFLSSPSNTNDRISPLVRHLLWLLKRSGAHSLVYSTERPGLAPCSCSNNHNAAIRLWGLS